MITLQNLFDRVATHLLTQNEQSIGIDGECLYRGPKGRRCAAGCLIDDAHYDPLLEGSGVFSPAVMAAICGSLGVPGLEGLQSNLLFRLQCSHDMYMPTQWRERLAVLAEGFGLSKDVLKP